MILAPLELPSARLTRAIARRTRGQKHGPVTRLMSPSDFGAILKPFVFLDLFDYEGPPFNGCTSNILIGPPDRDYFRVVFD
jgi:hypothetical protein